MTIDQVQTALGLSYGRVYHALRAGHLDGEKLDGVWDITPASVERYKAARAAPPAQPADGDLARKLAGATLDVVNRYHALGVQRVAILNALDADAAEARAADDDQLAEALTEIVRLLPLARYRWTGDSWLLTIAGAGAVESRGVADAEPQPNGKPERVAEASAPDGVAS